MENENTMEKEVIKETPQENTQTISQESAQATPQESTQAISQEASQEKSQNVIRKMLSEISTEAPKEEVNETPRVLIVEDDETARISLKAALEAQNIFVEAVENGANAENMVKYSTFDVVIVDYRLPDIDGLSLIKKMKILVPDIMTLVVTAHTSVEIAVDAMKMGAYDYMSKPLDIDNLINTIYKILNDKKDLYDSRQKVTEMVTKKFVDYLFNDEKISVITAPNPNILVDGKSSGGFFKSIKKFFIGIKNYYWGA